MPESLISNIDILDEAKDCFLTYSSEVLTDRAIPAAEDGLLSSQRKLLWTMEDYLKMDHTSKTKKCNALVGSTLATSYFHGDAACYGVLCKMSQPFLMRYPLVEGQGSLGTQESNDMVASSRYTEARPSKFADLMMENFKKNVVPLKETYNGEFMEPVILPGLFPNAMCNGRQAIGVSMSHNSAPHNLTEVCNAICAYIDDNNLTIDGLMQYIKGPDFPMGGTIINQRDIKAALATGKSNIGLKIRGDYEIKGNDIIFTSIPYRTYRNKIKEQIQKNIDEFMTTILDFDDESNMGKTKMVFHVKDAQSIPTALNKLFKFTDLQSSVSYNMNYIVNGTPKLCSMLDLIKAYVNHQSGILVSIAQYDKDKAEQRVHIIEGLLIALADIDTAIALIRASENKVAAQTALINHFHITEIQAKAILDMKLSRLTKLDKTELEEELKEKQAIVAECNKIIKDSTYRNNKLKTLVINMRDKYGDARRTQITTIDEPKEDKEIQFVEPEKCVVVLTEAGTVKRIPATSFKTQKRAGKGVKTQEDITSLIIRTNTVDSLMIFTNKGRMYRLLVNDIPVGTNVSKGTYIKSLINMEIDEQPQIIYSIYRDKPEKYVLFITKNGTVKKTALDEYINTKRNGIGAISLREGDSIAQVCLINDEPIVIVTAQGKVVKFDSKEIPASSRMTIGIKGIVLGADDSVVAALPMRDADDQLALFTKDGRGKRISNTELGTQKRGAKGSVFYKGAVVAAASFVSDTDMILIVGNRSSLCINAADIPVQSKTAAGNVMIKDNTIIAVSKV